MANYFIDFDGYTVGDDPAVDGPAEFSKPWHDGAMEVQDASALTPPLGITNALRPTYSSLVRVALTIDAVDSDPNADDVSVAALIYVPFTSGGGAQTYGGVVTRLTGTSTSETGVIGAISSDSGGRNLTTIEYDNASATTDDISSSPPRWPQGEWFWIHSTVAGSVITTTIRLASDPQTVISTIQTTGIGASGSGGAGLFFFRPENAGPLWIGAVEVATDGDLIQFSGGADTTAPTLTSASGTQTGPTTADLAVTTDESGGTLYAVVQESATPPDIAEVKAGQDQAGSAAAWAGSISVASSGAQELSATGLEESTSYYAFFVHTDAAGNDSAVAASAQFTTPASGGTTIPGISEIFYALGVPQASINNIQWFATEGGLFGSNIGFGLTASTNTSGRFQVPVNLSASTLQIGDWCLLVMLSPDATPDPTDGDTDSVACVSLVQIKDIG